MAEENKAQQPKEETVLSLSVREAVVQNGVFAAQEILVDRGFLKEDTEKYIQEYAPDQYGTPTEATLPNVIDKMASRAWSVVKGAQRERDRISEIDNRDEEENFLRESWNSFHRLAVIQDNLKAGKPDEAIAEVTKARDASLDEIERYAEKLPLNKEPLHLFVGSYPIVKNSFSREQERELALDGTSFLEAAYNYVVLNRALGSSN